MNAYECLLEYSYPLTICPQSLLKDAEQFERVAQELKNRASYHMAQIQKHKPDWEVPQIDTRELAQYQLQAIHEFESSHQYEVVKNDCSGYTVE